jgi:hypothetical protein|tara:strand:- start:48 stop:779 length:732 start_codon:yes stop_codon:yes gene_type:complete
MFGYKKKSQVLVLAILIIICGINTNFFKNFAEVILHKFDDRIVNRYGFCSGESIGYLLYLKKKYEIKNNPKIINYVHTPSVNWAMVNTKNINKSSKKLILLNYPGSELKINLKKINNNLFELSDAYFFSKDKFSKIESVEILNNSNNFKKINWKLDLLTIDKYGNKKIVKGFNINNILTERIKINLDVLNKNLNLNEKKLLFKIKNKNSTQIENLQIYLILKNKYILEDFQIIDKINNCYYVE